jgi:hypothetical protein
VNLFFSAAILFHSAPVQFNEVFVGLPYNTNRSDEKGVSVEARMLNEARNEASHCKKCEQGA